MGGKVSKEDMDHLTKLLNELNLSITDCDIARKTFKKFCRTRKNALGKQDFRDFLQMMNMHNYNEVMINTVFHVLDTNADGQLDLIEFSRYFILLTRFPMKCKVHLIFDVIDRDKSGAIDRKEMRDFYLELSRARAHLMESKTAGLKNADIDTVFNEMDKDGNQMVERDEFVHYIQTRGPLLMQLLDAYIESA